MGFFILHPLSFSPAFSWCYTTRDNAIAPRCRQRRAAGARANAVLARHYGFTDEELEFIINYDIKYRMGKDEGEEE